MLRYLVQCEICPNHFPFNPIEPNVIPPPNWLTLFQGELQFPEGKHFCSTGCLSDWLSGQRIVRLSVSEGSSNKGKGK
jgi:hypothetical protein